MIRRIVTAPLVRQDIRTIVRYIAGFNREIGERFELEFWNCIDMLKANPEIGKTMPVLSPRFGLFVFPNASTVIWSFIVSRTTKRWR